ncbi:MULTISPECIES: hypothetical protein [Streptomyces]|uniref:Uncharacterized protein n=1 Tax=Streptomyces venezuelae TaxID=54571 RepID=A0A5P2AM88_STRVZ|nr:hypothetical protein [Streptomyces venezuelae]QES18708.1 hypothetical protein DEJ46_06080 [Streptomyces venezuelae]
MTPSSEPIGITRGRGGEVEVDGGPIDSFAAAVLRRAGFLFEPSLRGPWIHLPFDMGEAWESAHATWAADMLTAARYRVALDPTLYAALTATAPPTTGRRTTTMTQQPSPPVAAPRLLR